MAKIAKYIEIVRSTAPGLSSMGQKSCDMIAKTLRCHYEHVGVTIANDAHDLELLADKRPDLVFLGVKKLPDRQGSVPNVWASACLDDLGINYTGSTAPAIELDFSKAAAKQVVQAAGLATAAFFVAHHGQYEEACGLPLDFPLFVKPPSLGGGRGIGADSVVRTYAGYEQKVRSIRDMFHTSALVETYLPGREFSVAILETVDANIPIAMPVELITDENRQGDRVLGGSIKNADTERALAVRDGEVKRAVTNLAIDVFKILGGRDYGRIDIRMDERGVPYFLEANLIPGLSYHDFTSYFTSACWINRRMGYEAMILHITNLGLSRNPGIEVVSGVLSAVPA